MKRAWMVFVLLISIAPSQTAQGQPLAEHLPADTILYLGWRGSEHLGPGYPDSHLKAMIEMSQIRTMISEVMPKAINKLADKVPNPEAQKAADFMSTVGLTFWKYPTAFCLAGRARLDQD